MRTIKYASLLVLLMTCSCAKKTAAPAAPPTFPVKMETVTQKEVPIYIEALGHVDSITSIQIKSRIEGEITGIFFTQGQDVKKGDLLFTIDPQLYEAALKAAQGTLEENLANLAIAKEKLKRFGPLTKDQYYSQIDYETLQANAAAIAGLVEQNLAQVQSAKINLSYCWIYAPIDGKMGILQVDYGNLVRDDGTNLVTLNQMEPIFVTFSIPEFQLPSVQKYNKKDNLIVLGAYNDFTSDVFAGTLSIVDNSVDENTGMIKMRATFSNDERPLWPGQFVRVRLVLYTMPDAVVVPFTSLQFTQAGPVLFVVKSDNTVEQRAVELGQRNDSQIIVLQGVTPGETIVTEGQLNLHAGAKVQMQ